MRKQLREERKQALEKHVQLVHNLLEEAEAAGNLEARVIDGDDDGGWQGFGDDGAVDIPLEHEDEYIDEDRYTTVTVESVTVSRDGLHKPAPDSADGSDEHGAAPDGLEEGDRGGETSKSRQKKKKKQFRYENKIERQVSNRKQKARNKIKSTY